MILNFSLMSKSCYDMLRGFLINKDSFTRLVTFSSSKIMTNDLYLQIFITSFPRFIIYATKFIYSDLSMTSAYCYSIKSVLECNTKVAIEIQVIISHHFGNTCSK